MDPRTCLVASVGAATEYAELAYTLAVVDRCSPEEQRADPYVLGELIYLDDEGEEPSSQNSEGDLRGARRARQWRSLRAGGCGRLLV